MRAVSADGAEQHAALLGDAPARLIAAVGTIDAAPVLLLRSMRLVPDEVWAAAAALAVPS